MKSAVLAGFRGTSSALAVALAVLAGGASAEIAAPTLKAAGFINGHLNVTVKGAGISTYRLQVQMKDRGAGDEAYRDVYNGAVTALPHFTANGYDGRTVNCPTNFIGTATLRMRTLSGEEASAWVAVGDHSAYVNVRGTAIGTSTQFSNAVDGYFFSMVDESTNPWIGYEFSERIRVRGVRVFSRPDDSCYTRFNGATIQCAGDAAFSDAQTVFTARTGADGNVSRTTVTDVFFAEPLLAKCVRIVSAPSPGRSSVCEFEVIPMDVPFKPENVAAVRSDLTNFWPVVTWTCPPELMASEVRVTRATSSEGPYEPVCDWMAACTCFTNDVAYEAAGGTVCTPHVGIEYHYRVEAKTSHPSFAGQTARAAPVAYRRVRRLDRAWGDETRLLDGLSILKATNGVKQAEWTRAWDGLAAGGVPAFADVGGVFADGPIGLDFGKKTWVSSFGYICRNDNWCYVRIKCTALYAASGTDQELKDKVRVSALCQRASQDTTLYVQDCTQILPEGAPWYFLYFTQAVGTADYFGGNVAEVMLFGWDEDDVAAAGVLVAPKTLSFDRSADGRSVTVAWDAGANAADGYELQRRPRASGEDWTPVAATPAGTTCAVDSMDASPVLAQGVWEYRVVARKGDARQPSPVVSYAYYEPGDGTGLSGVLLHPFVATDAAKSWPDEAHALDVGPVDCHWAKGETYPGTTFSTEARLAWRGKVLAPFEGTYDFSLTTTDGGAVTIDGVGVCNSWTGGTKTPRGSINLTAGAHDIEVDARLQVDDAGRACVLSWGGVVPSGVVPATQLRPAPEVALGVDGWTFRSFGGAKLGRADRRLSGGYLLSGPAAQPADRDHLNASMLARRWNRSLDISMRVETTLNGRCGPMLRTPNGNLYALYYNYDGSGNGYVGVYIVTNGVGALARPFGEQKIAGWSNVRVDLRLSYDVRTRTFTAWWKDGDGAVDALGNPVDNPLEWTELHTWQDADASFAGTYEYGPFVSGATANHLSQFAISRIEVTLRRDSGTVITFR